MLLIHTGFGNEWWRAGMEEAICMPHLFYQFTKLSGEIIKEWRFDENNLIKSESEDIRFEFYYCLHTSKNVKSCKAAFERCIHAHVLCVHKSFLHEYYLSLITINNNHCLHVCKLSVRAAIFELPWNNLRCLTYNLIHILKPCKMAILPLLYRWSVCGSEG